ncbi:hypothetical protein [Rhizohabitans arisaemae]|uniref:hypothetical protein n=1 Tax=Rhizohabitans arisaemae TaxID=2720610 RepID=UPI0024B15A9F|nr:hypothetical protein [Rhizohabitans arisaemae]
MRTIRLNGPIIDVTDDPNQAIGDFLGYALSVAKLSGRPRAEELAERFAPGGKGLVVPDCYVAYRATEPDWTVPELSGYAEGDFDRMEIWVLTKLGFGEPDRTAVLEGSEVRHLLKAALALYT